MSVQDVAIEVSHLTAGYPGVRVLEDVSFSVKRGEIFALLGGSGCGKSTIMKHLIGLVPARGGTITVDSKEGEYTEFAFTVPGCSFDAPKGGGK